MGIRGKLKICAAACAAAALMWTPPGRADAAAREVWFGNWWGRRPAVESERRLMPGGSAVGVEVATRGVTVIGVSDLGGTDSPARHAGLKAGDVILAVDGAEVNTALELQQMIQAGGERRLTVSRGGETLALTIEPTLGDDGSYRMGAWVRDGAAGIGTLTFYDPGSGTFGALGHAISDADSGEMIGILGGALVDARIQGVRKSEPGSPGELMGSLGDTEIGQIGRNTHYGVFGQLAGTYKNPIYPDGVEVLPMNEVKVGPAKILSTVDGGAIQEYDCEIVSAQKQESAETRGLLIRVTDPRLLSVTGGIVQGMSGSPILQDGKLVGAVTHVCMNDPACGYGVYIDWMLQQSDEISKAA